MLWKLQNIDIEDYLERNLVSEIESLKIIDEVNLFHKPQMQKYFIKPGTVDNKNPQQEKPQSLQQCSSSMNVDGQGSNPAS